MINLVKGIYTPQVVTVTLNEKLPCNTLCYTPVFKFMHILTGQSIYFTANDLSSFTGRYNYFEITLVEDISEVDILDGKIFLENTGLYFYDIYLQPCDVIGVDPDLIEDKLESGYVQVRPLDTI